jgi:hypothetical protein
MPHDASIIMLRSTAEVRRWLAALPGALQRCAS